jgi:TolB-like protein/DNA-binding winged helix-turn-helix (wHTH) protein/cytochrome c-type biogenesis protein CcmH/NrfG
MEPTAPNSGRIAFDRFEVDLRSGELLKNGRRLRLQPQPFQLLALLLEHPAEVVTREEICRKLWQADTFVDFDHSLGTAIGKIREALGDSPDSPRFVETLPRRGYRFIGKIQANATPPSASNAAPSDADGASAVQRVDKGIESSSIPSVPQSSQRRNLRFVLVLAASLAVLLAAAVFVRRFVDARAAVRAASIRSIAVLPLENLSGNPAQEYFTDGMTDELITELARTKGLRVISKTSVMQYKGVHRPLKEIARELGVDGILEGSVLNDGSQVRVTVQLVHAPSDTHVWAKSYIRDSRDLLVLQQELAENVAKEVNSAALPAKVSSRGISPEAHDAYLRGRYDWFAGNYETARESFEKAIQLQPDYSAAYAGLAEYYTGAAVSGVLVPKDALPRGDAAAQKALQLDDSAEEAHNAMAGTYLFYRWNWKAAEKESLRAIELNPSFAEGYHLYGYVLLALNRNDDAVEAQRKSQELDPFARPWGLGYALNCVGKYKEAEIDLRQRVEALPKNHRLRYELAGSYLAQGRERESMEEFAEMLRMEGNEKSAAEVRVAFAKEGNRGFQEWRLAQVKQKVQKGYVSPMEMASAYARLGQDDEAIRWLEKAYDDHVPALVRIQRDLDLNRLHRDPRFLALVKRIGLPQAD